MDVHRLLRQATVLLVLCCAGLVQAAPRIGQPSPVDLIGVTPDGEQIRISDHHGKVVVVSFWASWCGYCRRQFPLLEHVQRSAGPDALRVVVVNHQEPAADYRQARRALRKAPVTWTHDHDGALADALGVQGVPYMLVFDKTGHLAAIRRGYSDASAAPTIELLNGLLAAPDPAPAAAGPGLPQVQAAGPG